MGEERKQSERREEKKAKVSEIEARENKGGADRAGRRKESQM